jgi:hypothetical protein
MIEEDVARPGPPPQIARLMRAVRTFLIMPLASLLVLRPLAAQNASPYVPLGHWAMPYIEHLISAGVLADPTPLTRPLKQGDVVRALLAADTTVTSAAVRATVHRLLQEWQPVEHRPHYRAEMSAGALAATQAVRDPLELGRGMPARTIDRRVFGNAGLDVELLFGPFVAVSHPIVDTRLKYDPDWYATEDNSTRFAEAYVSGQWRLGEVFFGILDRNWGPSGIQGVVLSDNPYSMDHLAVRLGGPGIQLQSMATQLNTLADSSGAPVNRYMVWNRVWIHPRGRWTLALWEAAVTSGVGRQLEPWYLNLASLSYFRASNGTNANSFVGVDVERRAGITLFGQFMFDDVQVSRKAATDLKPASYAFTIGGKGRAGTGTATWVLFYTQVANLTYRNEDNLQVPLYFGLPTGRNFDDYDQATAKLSLILRPALALEPEVTLLRQGKGDPRLLHPLPPQYPSTAVLFQGVVERTVRLALGGRWQLGGVSVTGNGGVHLVHNAGHVPGASRTQWVGAIGLTYRFRHQDLLP